MRKGFTLLELVVVIIILGILATLGIQQYMRMVEKSRGAEARSIIGQIRSSAAAHRLEYGDLNGATSGVPFTDAFAGVGANPDQIPNACRTTHYFQYAVTNVGPDSVEITATRCVGGGKNPQGAVANVLQLDTDLATGVDSWNDGAGAGSMY